jgi:membrane protease YdiL (CAAX protease family)
MAPVPTPEDGVNLRNRRREIAVFLVVAFGGSILLSLVIGLSGGSASSLLPLAPLTMFVPALAVLAVRKTTSARLGVDGMYLPLRSLPAVLFLLPFAIHAICLPGVFFLEGKLPWIAVSWPRVVLNAIASLLVVSFLAFFEEIGWRAFLLPRLADRFGMRRAAALSAAIWALWHIPYSLSGILHVENVSRLGLAIVHPMGTFGAGLFLALLWFRTGSLPLVSLAHGAFNNWGQFAFKYMKISGQHDLTLLVLVAIAALAVGIGALARIPSSASE